MLGASLRFRPGKHVIKTEIKIERWRMEPQPERQLVPKFQQICFPNKGRLPNVFSRMETNTKYREFAEECERMARLPELKQHRAALLEMAEAWREVASKEEAAG